MNFGFSEDQTMIRNSAKDFVAKESSLERVRGYKTSDTYYSEDLYKRMADNGWVGAIIPEEYGGVGLGYVDLICIMEEFGSGLIPEPILSSQVLGGNTLLQSNNESLKSEWLPKIADGSTKFTLACYELAGRYNLAHVETTATASGDGYTLKGEKSMVTDASAADYIIVSARLSGKTDSESGIGLFLVNAKSAGVSLTAISTMDQQSYSMLSLNNVKVSANNCLTEEGFEAVSDTIAKMNVALCAEMVGGMSEALRITVAYTHERIQFDRPIGSFQAVKHKAANMYVNLEAARSNMYYAAMAVDNAMPETRKVISGAKAMCSDAYLAVTKEAIQLHGGIGFTDEHVIHFFYKRAQASATNFGDAMYHREQYLTEMARLANVQEGAIA